MAAVAIDIEPATSPAMPAVKMTSLDADDAATPIMRLAVDTIASSDPSTAARSHPARPLRCASLCLCRLDMRFNPPWDVWSCGSFLCAWWTHGDLLLLQSGPEPPMPGLVSLGANTPLCESSWSRSSNPNSALSDSASGAPRP